jgi:histidine ammonia-lyase
MGWGAGRKLVEVLANTARVIAVELICAAEGVEHRRPLAPGRGTGAVLAEVRSLVEPLETDRPPGPSIEAVARAVREGAFVAAAEAEVGSLR